MERSRLEPEPPRSWTARVLAPLALIAVVAAIYLVVSGSLGDDDGGDKESSKERTQTSSATCESPEDPEAAENGYYVVTADDTAGLSGIAAKTCVPLERLERLNPNLDPQTLQVENCVDLIRDGCQALAG